MSEGRAPRRSDPLKLSSPMHLAPRCGPKATTRNGSPCRSPAMENGRCRMNGGPSPGAPKGERNSSYRHGRFTRGAIQARWELNGCIRMARRCAGGLV